MPALFPIKFDTNGYSMGVDTSQPVASDRKPANVRVYKTRPADPLLKRLVKGKLQNITQEDRDAYDAEQVAARQTERIAGLAEDYAETVEELAKYLAVFGLRMPVDIAEARKAMSAEKPTVIKLQAAVLADHLFRELREAGLTGEDIAAIAEAMDA